MPGYWFGKMVSAILQPQQLRSTLENVQALQSMGIVNINTIKDFNQNSSSRCPMKSTTMVKGKWTRSTRSFSNIFWIIEVGIEVWMLCWSLIGKVAADHSHKWIYKEPNDQEINFLSAWHNSADSVRNSSIYIICITVYMTVLTSCYVRALII